MDKVAVQLALPHPMKDVQLAWLHDYMSIPTSNLHATLVFHDWSKSSISSLP